MKNKLMMLAVFIAIASVCAMSALAIPGSSTVVLGAPANYTTNATKSNHTFTWTASDDMELTVLCNLSLRDSAGTSHTWGPLNVTNATAFSYDANFSAGAQGRFTWTANCTNSSGPYVDGGVRSFVWDLTGPVFANITQTTNVVATSSASGNYTVTVDVYDALNAVGTATPVRLWYGYSGTAGTARTMTRVGTTNRYTTTVLVGIGQTVIYDVTATDSLSNAATSSSTTYSAASSTSCDTTKTIIYAAFGLISVLAIVGGAYVLINMGMSEGSTESMGAMLVGLIVLGVSILVGFYVISNLASITCLA